MIVAKISPQESQFEDHWRKLWVVKELAGSKYVLNCVV